MEIFLIALMLSIIFLIGQCILYFQIDSLHARVNSLSDYHHRKYDHIEKQLSSMHVHLSEVDASFIAFIADQRRTLLAFRDSLETTKPIKPNNWDSVKEAFKGPTRVDVHERN
jgi:hypothetical protein